MSSLRCHSFVDEACAPSASSSQMGDVLSALHRGAEDAWPSLQTQWERSKSAHRNQVPHFDIEVVPEIASTNAALMQRVRLPHAQPCILVAAHQSAGRGRMGKAWASTSGDSLTFSMAVPFAPHSWSGLSLAVGVSLAESLSSLSSSLNIGLKWPNDLWVEGKKLAGILIETAHIHDSVGAIRWAVIGVGINLKAPSPSALTNDAAATVSRVAPIGLSSGDVICDVGTLFATVAPVLLSDLLRFEEDGFLPFQSRFAQRDVLWQQELHLSDGTAGTGMGVDEHGVLLVQTSDGLLTINSQEVSVRPVQKPTGNSSC